MTGAFGGVLRDLLCNRIPLDSKKNFYASVSAFFPAVMYGITTYSIRSYVYDFTDFIQRFCTAFTCCLIWLGLPVFDFQEQEDETNDKLPKKTKQLKRNNYVRTNGANRLKMRPLF